MRTTLKLIFHAETNLARLYELKDAKTQWVPRSVCPAITKHGNQRGDIHEVTIEDWWLKDNPFAIKPQNQPDLL
jgi:hypothetical protein